MRKLGVLVHLVASLGWLGAAIAFFPLALADAAGAMSAVLQWILVPLCFASLLTGVVQALATPWGLFRHYWVILKLILTAGATALLMLHRTARHGLLVQDCAAIVLLLVPTVLGVYKPRGVVRPATAPSRSSTAAR